MVLPGDREELVSCCRYLVADGDRHADDHNDGRRADASRVCRKSDPRRRCGCHRQDRKTGAPGTGGFLVIKKPWPAMLRTVYKNDERYRQYWETIPGVYAAGDLAVKGKDGYIMVIGRADDIIIVSGHNIGTAEVESALVSHNAVAEAAVIGKPDPVKGNSIKAFVILRVGNKPGDKPMQDLIYHVRMTLGPIAVPQEIEFVDKLPKTRSGKIMRRVLKAKELGMDPGDISTLEE